MAQVRTKWISESCSTAFLGTLCKNLGGVHLFFFKTLKIEIFSNRNPDRFGAAAQKAKKCLATLILDDFRKIPWKCFDQLIGCRDREEVLRLFPLPAKWQL